MSGFVVKENIGPIYRYNYKPDNSRLARQSEGFYGRKVVAGETLFKFPSLKTVAKVTMIASGIIAIAALLISSSIFFPVLAIPSAVSAKTLIASSSVFASSMLVGIMSPQHSIFCNIQKKEPAEEKEVDGKSAALVTHDSIESFEWKKKFIQGAQKNIVLSGNYCGGESFDEILDLIKKKYEENPVITVIILSSSKFLTTQNKEAIAKLQAQNPDRFAMVLTDDIWTINPGVKKATNHTKALSIDNGAYFMTGGSGIENKYAFFKGIGDREAAKATANGGWLTNFVLPRGFRDMDFVFKSTPDDDRPSISVGKHFHNEVLSLAALWNGYNEKLKTDSLESVERNKQVLEILKKQLQEDIEETNLPDFDRHKSLAKDTEMRIYSTGPEMERSYFHKAIIERIEKAEESIYINHMYYHPSEEAEQALVDAANRGVKIHILTNDNQSFSPVGHKLFGRRNRYNCHKLMQKIQQSKRSNLSIYFYGQKYSNTPRKTTLHKKMIIIDDYVIGGSSNFGYKSMITMSDHEINFIARSQAMAEKAREIFDEDIFLEREAQDSQGSTLYTEEGRPLTVSLSRPARDLTRIDLTDQFYASIHRLYAPLIG